MAREEITRVEKLVHGGEALVRFEDGVAFLHQALPGELVRVRIEGRRKGRLVASLVEVLEASPHRRKPACVLFGTCGGCDWQHLSYDAQIEWKRRIVAENLRRIGGLSIDPSAIEVVRGAEYGYRNRIQLHRDERGVLGFRRRRSRSLVAVAECPVATPRINRLLHEWADGTNGVDDVAPPHGERTTIIDGSSGLALGDRDRSAAVAVDGIAIRFDPAGFAQANHALLPELARTLRRERRGRRIVDLYAGAGLLAALATDDEIIEIVCVEPDSHNARFIRGNLNGNGRRAVHVINGTAEEALGDARLVSALGYGGTILLDPPRRGLGPTIRAWLGGGLAGQLGGARSPRVIYMSCDAATLARDLGALSSAYRLTALSIFDFYPQTAHIECLAVLDPAAAPPGETQ
ncbi:MAG: hypothetical protein MI724_10120 [Spirochaetales bacterium]|nr:hypothetical protein [Spirochaetales bacterium]